jgi:hypothetical protein
MFGAACDELAPATRSFAVPRDPTTGCRGDKVLFLTHPAQREGKSRKADERCSKIRLERISQVAGNPSARTFPSFAVWLRLATLLV